MASPDRDYSRGGRGISPYPPGEPLTTMRVPRRIVAQVKAFAEKLAWETLEDEATTINPEPRKDSLKEAKIMVSSQLDVPLTVKCVESYCGHRRKITHLFNCEKTFVRQLSSTEIDSQWEEQVAPTSDCAGYVEFYCGHRMTTQEAHWLQNNQWQSSDSIRSIPDGPFKDWLKEEGVELFSQYNG